jgi:hypothetical protein
MIHIYIYMYTHIYTHTYTHIYIYILVITFAVLNLSFTFWNVSVHFVTLITCIPIWTYSYTIYVYTYIQVITFTVLNPSFEFWNVSVHFVTLMTLLVEMSLNKLIVRFDHYPFNIMWAYIYLIFVWVIVYMGVVDWPYFFLHTGMINHLCFMYM